MGTIRGPRERYSRSHIFIVCFIGRRGGGGGVKEGMRWRGNDVSVMFWKVLTFYSNWKKNGSTMNSEKRKVVRVSTTKGGRTQ